MSKISALPAAAALDGTEVAPVVQSAVTVKATASAIANTYKGTKGTDIASAATVDLGSATGNAVHLTGSTGPITSFGTAAAGVVRTVIFDSTPTLTHNGTSLILPTGGNIVAQAGDTAVAMSEGSGNWRVLSYQRKSGIALVVTDRNTVTPVTSSAGVVTLNWALGDYFTLALSENVTSWAISNGPGSGKGFTLMVEIEQDSTPRTVAKPGTTAGGVALDVSTGSGDFDVLAITSFDNGTTLRSSIGKDFT